MSADSKSSLKDKVLGGLWGSLIGDALGVPVEFKDRDIIQKNPVREMRGFGTHHQPPGTWSDDGALLLCSLDSLVNHDFDTTDMGRRFVRWMNEGLWTANGDVFDIGMATASALTRIAKGVPAEQAGGGDENSNGNGSLMRIIPVALRFANEPLELFADRIGRASALTHEHKRSQMACVLFGLVVRHLLTGQATQEALVNARKDFAGLCQHEVELRQFQRFLTEDFAKLPEGEIVSSGYVMHTLHASLWCLVTGHNFSDCVLKAVNLGSDTDTTGCVTGGLAGVAFGKSSIPPEWVRQLARRGDVDCLTYEFATLCEEAGLKGANPS